MSERQKIGFLTISDARNPRSWSGTYYFMGEALQRNVGDIVYLGPIETRLAIVGKLLNLLSVKLFGKKYDYSRSSWYARRVSILACRRIAAQHLDCIVAPAAASALAFLKRSEIPLVFVADTTFALINNYYDTFSNYLSISVNDGHRLARLAMQRADIVTFPSQWAANSARNDYGIDQDKLHVIPFGANLESIPLKDVALQRRRSGECRLLFLGVDWERKGGDIAFETLLSLEEKYGIRANLTVCGCHLPEGVEHERLTSVGFLDKRVPAQAEQLSQLFIETDYLLLPTRKECFGVVFCEASAYGVPSISTDTGGVAGVVAEGRNGFLLPEAARGDEYARVIAGIEVDDKNYSLLCRSSRLEYDNRINWDVWARHIQSLLDELKGKRL